jgi:phosphoribosylformimino-5-aminoimidazole carboxamide ribonucleotide (ProFAR) isomerase
MLIPSIDLKNGKVVQLVQGERLAIEDDDLPKWIDRFARFPAVQLIDLDAAIGTGTNDGLVAQVCAARPCRVGGGIRTTARAREVVGYGATHVIVGSSLFREGHVDLGFAEEMSGAVGRERVIAAVDSRGGQVTIHGWRTTLPLHLLDAVRTLEHFCAGFLCTLVDGEGLMQGIDMDAVRAVRAATDRQVIAAGGITTREEIEALDAMGVDAVVGMAIYTGRLSLDEFGT